MMTNSTDWRIHTGQFHDRMNSDFTLSFTRTGHGYTVRCCQFGGLARDVESYEPGAWQVNLPDGGQIVLMHFAPGGLADGDAFEVFIAQVLDEND